MATMLDGGSGADAESLRLGPSDSTGSVVQTAGMLVRLSARTISARTRATARGTSSSGGGGAPGIGSPSQLARPAATSCWWTSRMSRVTRDGASRSSQR